MPSNPDLPNSYIGRSVPRPNAKYLVAGKGSFTDDIAMGPRLGHVVFLRSPFSSAIIRSINVEGAAKAEGILAVLTAKDLEGICTPWTGILTHYAGMVSPAQYPLASERVTWCGEPVVAIVGATRALAEDAIDKIEVEWEPTAPVVSVEEALSGEARLVNPQLSSNTAYATKIEAGNVDESFAKADHIVAADFEFGRHTGVTLEPRTVVANYDEAREELTVHQSTQTPYQMRVVYARHLQMPENRIRVVASDVGGSFGLKLHVYPDEMAAVAISKLLRRPIKFVADRLESFVSDIHARDHKIKAELAIQRDGKIIGFRVKDFAAIGSYSAYPRTSAVEGNQVVRLIGAPYMHDAYKADLEVVFQNKCMTSQYRAVGHPIACAVTEVLLDMAANTIGIDALEIRRRNFIQDSQYPYKSLTGLYFEKLSHHLCVEKLIEVMDLPSLLKEQHALRGKGVVRGIGFAVFVETTSMGSWFYGAGGAPISAQDGCVVTFEPNGAVRCSVSVTEQGQGTEGIMSQIAASVLGVSIDKVKVVTGDTQQTPHGGATWGCRGAGIGGETVRLASEALKKNLLSIASAMLQEKIETLDIEDNWIVLGVERKRRMSLQEFANIVHFRTDTLPPHAKPQLTAAHHFVPHELPSAFTNGVQASYVEVDVETGFVRLLKHWVVEDCGRIINPMLVDEQIRGGVVQGLGAALFEECLYDEEGQMLNGSMADYLVPMASEMPDIIVAHVETPTAHTGLGAKGAGEAGTAGASAAVMNAVNNALRHLHVKPLTQIPLTPERVMNALEDAEPR